MSWAYYIVSPTRVIGIELDRGQVAVGDLEHQ
jgi:hypothetical protein